jgi:predicted outer membrane repeat protein
VDEFCFDLAMRWQGLKMFDTSFLSTIKPVVLAAADTEGIPRPNCNSGVLPGECNDQLTPLEDGQSQMNVMMQMQSPGNLFIKRNKPLMDTWKEFVLTYPVGGVDNGSAFVAGAWMQAWDKLSATTIYYVKPDESVKTDQKNDWKSQSNCTSWANACTLQDALSQAVNGEIWVTAGKYTPTTGTDRAATFHLRPGVAVYGGFVGTETLRDQRNPRSNITILSGDIDNNDSQRPTITNLITITDNTTNSYHVVTGANNAILDGFTITAGYADGADTNAQGAGMYNLYACPTLMNITFSGNAATYGGGMYNSHPYLTFENLFSLLSSGKLTTINCGIFSNPTLTNVAFSGNKAKLGGGMYNDGSNPTVTKVTFSSNSATQSGGGMYNDHSNPTMTDVTFRSNAANDGGGIENFVSSPSLTNVTFMGNTATNGNGGGMRNSSQTICSSVWVGGSNCHIDGGSPTLTNVTFSANTAKFGGGMDNDISSPTLTNVTFNGNTATTLNGGGSMHNKSQYKCMSWIWGSCSGSYWDVSAPIVKNSILWGTSSREIYNEIYREAAGDPPSTTQISNSVVSGGCPSGATCMYIITTDPKLGTLPDHNGFTPTIPLMWGSSAIDAGNDAACLTTDQRGVGRPQGAHCDIGAVEMLLSEVDTIPPTITAATTVPPNANGWYNRDVAIHFTCSDTLSGIPAGACPADQTLSSEGTAVQSTAETVQDAAGNVSTSNTVTVKIDKSAPTLNPAINPNPVLLNSRATATANASDAISGVASQACGAVDTRTLGKHTVNCTTTDHVGNTATQTITYTVNYGWIPSFDAPPTVNTGKAGLIYPVKWQLKDANGDFISNLSAIRTPGVYAVQCGSFSSNPTSTLESSESNRAGLRYNRAANQFIYNWSTPTKPGCYKLVIKLKGGQSYPVYFNLK